MVALVCAFVGWFLFQLFGSNPQIIVSKETTVITSPLGEDGLPDYQAYWRDLGREGITFENNGAVLFWRAIWPGRLSHDDELPMSDALGFERVPDSTDTLQDPQGKEVREIVGLWLTERYRAGLTDEASEVLLRTGNQGIILDQSEEVIGRALDSPWTSEQIPPLADWVKRNENAIDLLVKASKRPKWWSPSPSLLGNRYEGAVAILLPGAQSLRDSAWALCLRAMWHAGENRRDEAWKNLLACCHLARLGSQGNTIVEQMVAFAIDGIALQRTQVLLQHGEPDAKFSRQVLHDLTALEMPSDLVRAVDQGDRLMIADTILRLAGGYEFDPGFGPEEAIGRIGILSNDWNVALRDSGEWHDRMTEIVQLPSRSERLSGVEKYGSELDALNNWVSSRAARAGTVISRWKRSKVISAIIIVRLMPALDGVLNAQDRNQTLLDLTRTAAALAVYRAEQGEYPETLAELVPGIVAVLPVDLYSGKPFLYERKPDDGYLLYSVFENGTDDGANGYYGEIMGGEWLAKENEEFDYENSDMVIRVPMPKFALPTPPVLEE